MFGSYVGGILCVCVMFVLIDVMSVGCVSILLLSMGVFDDVYSIIMFVLCM